MTDGKHSGIDELDKKPSIRVCNMSYAHTYLLVVFMEDLARDDTFILDQTLIAVRQKEGLQKCYQWYYDKRGRNVYMPGCQRSP